MGGYHDTKPDDVCPEAGAIFDDLSRARDEGHLTFMFHPSDEFTIFSSFLIRFAEHIQSKNKDAFFAYLKHKYTIFNSYFTTDKRELRVFVTFQGHSTHKKL